MKPVAALLILLAWQGIHLTGYGQDSGDQLIRARYFTANGKASEAWTLLQSAPNHVPMKADWLLASGLCQLELDKPGEALPYFIQLAELRQAEGFYYAAICAVRLNREEEALIHLRKHLESPDHYPERSLKNDKAFIPLENNRGWQVLWQNDWYSTDEQKVEEARYQLSRANGENPLALLEVIPSHSPEYPEALFLRGRFEMVNGNAKEALELMQRAITLASNDRQLLERMDRDIRQYKYADLENQVVNRLIELDPTNPDYLIQRSLIRLAEATPAVAQTELKKFEDWGLPVGEIYYLTAVKLTKELPDQAIMNMNEAIRLSELDHRYFNLRAELLDSRQRWGESMADYSMSLDINPNQPEVYVKRGRIRYELGDTEGACYDWKKAFQLGSPEAADLLARHCR